jgi:peptidoglycan hydrolase-like protein with peptidoglycan-binding domain
MAMSGLTRIDGLFGGAPAVQPVGPGDADKDSVGAIQDLLRGQGQPSMPTPLAPDYGLFGAKTTAAVNGFRNANGLQTSDIVDVEMMKALVQTPAKKPTASRPYVTLALDLDWSGLTKIVVLTSILEGEGAFGALNLNTDKAGLSYGVIQWAQKPKRLHEILQAFSDADGDAFTAIFGGGGAAVASRLLDHTALPNGGVDSNGNTTDDSFDLTNDAWTARFQAATLSTDFQKVQVKTALQAFQNSLNTLNGYAPEFTTERAVAFMLDLANQFGDAGARSIYSATAQDGQTVADHLSAIADESVNRMDAQFQAGTRNRRNLFLDTPMLADPDS